jgi:hypothetical protein
MLVDIALRTDISTVSNDLHDMGKYGSVLYAVVHHSIDQGWSLCSKLAALRHSNRAGYCKLSPTFDPSWKFLSLSAPGGAHE